MRRPTTTFTQRATQCPCLPCAGAMVFGCLTLLGCSGADEAKVQDNEDHIPTPNGNGGGGPIGGGVAGSGSGATTGTNTPTNGPALLPDGRTYDHQTDYVEWTGDVSYVELQHKDETSLPNGQGNCVSGCMEQVTRIRAGGQVWGRFEDLELFSVQVAGTTDPNAGIVSVEACGGIVYSASTYLSTATGLPGFTNEPQPAWSVPSANECQWRIIASGGYVDFRAVTVKHRSTSQPQPGVPR